MLHFSTAAAIRHGICLVGGESYSYDLQVANRRCRILKLFQEADMTRVSKTKFFAAALLCAAFFTSVLLPGDAFARSCAAIIYEHANYGGASQCLQEGRYNLNNLRIGNDRLSSIKVRKGNRVIMFEHKNFSGRRSTVEKSYKFVGDRWNDIVSSIIVE